MLVPLLWMITTSLKTPGTEFELPPRWIPDPVVWANYLKVWRAIPFGRFFFNSTLISVCVTFGQVLTMDDQVAEARAGRADGSAA